MIVLRKKQINKVFTVIILAILIFGLSMIDDKYRDEKVLTNAEGISTKKIEWGIKRNDDNDQPDLGMSNIELLKKHNGIAMGNNEKKIIYITFDEGYEAGYTSRILEELKNNDVKATFFITEHYLNSQPDLVKQMIDEGHIVGNHAPNCLMSGFFSSRKLRF